MGNGQSIVQSYFHKRRRRSDYVDRNSGLEGKKVWLLIKIIGIILKLTLKI